MQKLNFHIVIPAHNEAQFLGETLSSLVAQTHKPKQLVIVNDNSTDQTLSIAETFSKDYSFITVVSRKSSAEHLPGSKVISAFNVGLKLVPNDADIIYLFQILVLVWLAETYTLKKPIVGYMKLLQIKII